MGDVCPITSVLLVCILHSVLCNFVDLVVCSVIFALYCVMLCAVYYSVHYGCAQCAVSTAVHNEFTSINRDRLPHYQV